MTSERDEQRAEDDGLERREAAARRGAGRTSAGRSEVSQSSSESATAR